MDGPELAEPGGHADEALLDEVDRVAQQVEREQDEQDRDDERDDQGEQRRIHVKLSGVTDPDRGSDCERRPADGGHDDGGARRDRLVVVREGEPCLAGQADVARMELVADLVEAERALADEAAVDARASAAPRPCA